MNIPENILQQVADAAFLELGQFANGRNFAASERIYTHAWPEEASVRRAVIQHALNNPALAPFLAGGVGEFTDQAIYDAWKKAVENNDAFPDRMRAFLAALPARPASEEIAALKAELAALRLRPIAEAGPVPPATPEPAQVPLGPEDVPPGAALKMPDWGDGAWRIAIGADAEGIWLACVKIGAERICYEDLFDMGAEINTSLATGRWDATAWSPCSKPAGKEVAK